MQTTVEGVKVDGVPVTVNELTVNEIRSWLKELDDNDAPDLDVTSSLLFEQCDLPTVCRLTSLSLEDIGNMYPSQIATVIEKCKKVNPSFFAMARRVSKIMELSNDAGQDS